MADMLNDGNIRLTYVPAIADPAAPTTTELTAGIDLECLVTADGLNISVDEETVSVQKLCETSNSQAPGRSTYGITLTIVRQDEETEDVGWTTLKRGTAGFLVMRYGVAHDQAWAASDKVQVFPGKCGERRPQQPEANGATLFQSQWFVGKQPSLDGVVASGV
ncbi:hypothetical protein [Prauserella muralis]|uniref:Uncharacterized protein n=1 Tax=Prauserella muralis TaxID=588067 RepID=A0A2V4AMM8_9PSEU|nr:hypothetical protein [Prauserella muralis]PXY20879.1 hypothetical protein BAY60_25585 [Prauserella muralis]TWE29919.1 hypothetical protein FHX69_2612 [Prauserella muralis]